MNIPPKNCFRVRTEYKFELTKTTLCVPSYWHTQMMAVVFNFNFRIGPQYVFWEGRLEGIGCVFALWCGKLLYYDTIMPEAVPLYYYYGCVIFVRALETKCKHSARTTIKKTYIFILKGNINKFYYYCLLKKKNFESSICFIKLSPKF